jgi:predicted metal-dependent peptidase
MKQPEHCALTASQEKLWSDTRVALMWHCPAFTHILYSMMDQAGSKHVAMFTGTNLLLNPDTFFKYNLNERIFIVAHEIMHCIWNHAGLMHSFMKRGKVSYPDGSELPYDQQTMNIATDLVINDCLIESKVGAFNKDWLHNKDYAVSTDSALDAYKKVFKQQQGKGKGPGGNGFDEHLAPGTSQGKDPSTAAQGRNEVEWQTQVAAGMNAARAQGKLPAGLDRLFGEILNPQVDWKEKIAALFARKVGSGSYDWRRADRRLIVRDIYAPGRSGFGAGTVVVGVDTSGSIGAKELDMFFAEMAGILEDVRPKRLVIMWCDADIGRVDEAEEPQDLNVIRGKGAPGGGGTDFRPVFDEIAKMGLEPDALVYLTDGYGAFPSVAPSFTVIWGNISAPGSVKYPFGDVVDVPVQAA